MDEKKRKPRGPDESMDEGPSRVKPEPRRADKKESGEQADKPAPSKKQPAEEENEPPRTTTGGWFTVPKFGSAGGGGAELEPGPKKPRKK